MALFAFYGGQCCVQKYFGFAWVKGEGRLLPMGLWTCDVTLYLLSQGRSGRVQYFFFQIWKGAKDLILDNWLSSAKFVLYYYISEIF